MPVRHPHDHQSNHRPASDDQYDMRTFRPAPFYPIAASTIHRLSDQVHVLGADVRGRYITHALACSETLPPVRVLTHSNHLLKRYGRGDNRIVLHNGDETIETTRAIVERIPKFNKYYLTPEGRLPPVTDIGSTEDGGFISNLIVTVPAESVVRSLSSILHRIQPTTTVCLLQDGLGVVEAVNDACFPKYGDQPLYILGHMSHILGKTPIEPFTVSEVRQGKLYLSALGHEYVESGISHHPPIERNIRVAHFLDVMSTTPRLHAGGYSLQKFMVKKLHETIIQSVLEPLTAILDCTFSGLKDSTYAKQMMDQLLGEILSVVARLPELKDSPDIKWMILYGEMRRDVLRRLDRMKDSTSRMRSQTNRGISCNIDFLNGYFVQRGRELGLRCPVNESVIWMVKAKHQQCLAKVRSEVELEPLF